MRRYCEHSPNSALSRRTNGGPIASARSPPTQSPPICRPGNVPGVDMGEQQAGIADHLRLERNVENRHVAIVAGGAIHPPLGREAFIERLCRVMASQATLCPEIVKIVAMERVAKIVGNPSDAPQFVEVEIV